jgi:hypothetical protein
MITVRNEFETVPAWEHIAGDSLGTWTERETTARMIEVLATVSQEDTTHRWKELALLNDEDTQEMTDMQDELAGLLNGNMPIPASCSVRLRDGEWKVLPYLDEDLPRLPDYQWESIRASGHGYDIVYVVNDHGNVTCYEWNEAVLEYEDIWAMV